MAGAPRAFSLVGSFAALTLAAVSVGIIWQSASGLVSLARAADTVDLAETIEQGTRTDATYLAHFGADNGLDHPYGGCNDTITRARLTVSLAAFESARNGADLTAMDAATDTALGAAKHRLTCDPLDGNAWLALSELQVQSSGPDRAALKALRLSYAAAPAEIWVIETRLPFATRLFLAGVKGFEADYLQDLRRFASNDPWPRVARTYVETDPRIRELLHPLIAAQPEERRREIVAEVDRLGLVF